MLLENTPDLAKLGHLVFIHLSYLGVSENSVPLNPLVKDHYPY